MNLFLCGTAFAKSTLILGLLPAESAVALLKRFAPLRDYLADSVQLDITLETARDIPEFARRTQTRRYDIVFTAPNLVIPALNTGRYELAATSVMPLRAVILVKENSPITFPLDLAGKHIATPPDEAFITKIGVDYLTQLGILKNESTQLSYYRSHNAAYSAVLAGEVDATMIANFVFNKTRKLKLPLRMVAQSDAFPGMGILIAADLSESIKEALKTVLIEMINQKRGKHVLKTISQPGYQATDVSEFEALRRISTEK